MTRSFIELLIAAKNNFTNHIKIVLSSSAEQMFICIQEIPFFVIFLSGTSTWVLSIDIVTLMQHEKMSFFKSPDHIIDVLDDSLTFSFGSNVTLVSNDEKCFRAHKIVLAASSKLLENFFWNVLMKIPLWYLVMLMVIS